MRKGEMIKGYKILQDFTTAGGGLSKWTFAEKNGKEYFFKEFLSPKYPTKDAPGSPKSKAQKRKKCEVFEKHHQSLMKQVNEKCGTGGNLVFTVDFFRNETKYFKVTEKIDVASLTIQSIAELSLINRILILKTIAHSLSILHKVDIVHGDLKPDNVLIKQTKTGSYTAKLIDFDNSYFSGFPPEISEDVVGDMVFYSPELAQYIQQSNKIQGKDLTVKSDIFALGLLFTQYLTGNLPDFNQEKYNYACMASLAGEILKIALDTVPKELNELINQMLLKDYRKRPSIAEVFERLKLLDVKSLVEEETLYKGISIKTSLKTSHTEKSLDETSNLQNNTLKGKGLNIGKK